MAVDAVVYHRRRAGFRTGFHGDRTEGDGVVVLRDGRQPRLGRHRMRRRTRQPLLSPRNPPQPVTTRPVRLQILREHDIIRPDEVPRQCVRNEQFAAQEVVHAEVERVLGIFIDEDGGDGGIEEQEGDRI